MRRLSSDVPLRVHNSGRFHDPTLTAGPCVACQFHDPEPWIVQHGIAAATPCLVTPEPVGPRGAIRPPPRHRRPESHPRHSWSFPKKPPRALHRGVGSKLQISNAVEGAARSGTIATTAAVFPPSQILLLSRMRCQGRVRRRDFALPPPFSSSAARSTPASAPTIDGWRTADTLCANSSPTPEARESSK